MAYPKLALTVSAIAIAPLLAFCVLWTGCLGALFVMWLVSLL